MHRPQRELFIPLPYAAANRMEGIHRDLYLQMDITIIDAEYVAFSKCHCVVVNAQQCSLLHGYMLYLHKNIFLTDIIGYDRLKFTYFISLQSEVLGTPLLLWLHEAVRFFTALRYATRPSVRHILPKRLNSGSREKNAS